MDPIVIIILLFIIITIIINLDYIAKSRLSAIAIPLYKHCYGIKDRHSDYYSFNDFFTRKKHRPIQSGVVSPVDSTILAFGPVNDDTLIQAKGKSYSLHDLVGFSPHVNLNFITFYLHPSDYHRVHMPCDATLILAKDIPGYKLPVNMLAVNNINGLYTSNKRSVLVFTTSEGKLLILVLVGAIFVNSIDHVTRFKKYKKGDEIGKFNFGSTVIMLYEPNQFQLQIPGSKVHYGQTISNC